MFREMPIPMSRAALSSRSGKLIPVKARRNGSSILIECEETEELLVALGYQRERVGVTTSSAIDDLLEGHGEGMWMRGVIIPGEGAFFDLFDAFGTCVHDVVRLTHQQAKERVLDLLIWEVKSC